MGDCWTDLLLKCVDSTVEQINDQKGLPLPPCFPCDSIYFWCALTFHIFSQDFERRDLPGDEWMEVLQGIWQGLPPGDFPAYFFFKTDIAPDLRCLWASSAFRHSTFPDFGIGCHPLLVTGSSLLSAEAVISLLLYSVAHCHRDSTINSHCLALGIGPAGGRRRYNALLGQDPSCGPSSLMASYKHTAGPGAPTLGSIILALTPK